MYPFLFFQESNTVLFVTSLPRWIIISLVSDTKKIKREVNCIIYLCAICSCVLLKKIINLR